jgi:hypothetical protein
MDRSRQKELIEYQRTPHWFDANRPSLGERSSLHQRQLPHRTMRKEEHDKMFGKGFMKYFATFGLRA